MVWVSQRTRLFYRLCVGVFVNRTSIGPRDFAACLGKSQDSVRYSFTSRLLGVLSDSSGSWIVWRTSILNRRARKYPLVRPSTFAPSNDLFAMLRTNSRRRKQIPYTNAVEKKPYLLRDGRQPTPLQHLSTHNCARDPLPAIQVRASTDRPQKTRQPKVDSPACLPAYAAAGVPAERAKP